MRYKKRLVLLVLFFCLAFPLFAQHDEENCTSAVISFHASANGAPLLWKNRDTDVLSNKVVYVKETPYSYLALVNAPDASGRHCFAGLNSAGFGVMNTVSYNLPKISGEMQDLEGIIMADALRTCKTVDDFENYIKANSGPGLGSQANFGVIDATGRAVLFEVHNHGYEKYDAEATPEKYLVNTNYARSGPPGKGAGYLRFERASQLFLGLPEKGIRFQDVLSNFSRDLGHVLLRHPTTEEMIKLPAGKDFWLFTRDCINRPATSAAVVIVGKNPNDAESLATMWVVPGEPVCAVAIPLWVEAGSSPESLWKGKDAPLWIESLRLKDIIRPCKEGNKNDYLNLTRLVNAQGTGFLPIILNAEKEILKSTEEFLKEKHTCSELANFQERMAEKALATLKSID